MEKTLLGDSLVDVPVAVHERAVFEGVFSVETWNSFSNEQKDKLLALLPKGSTKCDVDKLFDTSINIHFGHPVEKFRRQLKAGRFNASCVPERIQLRDNARVLYDHYIRRYYIDLLRTLLVSRRKLLESAARRPHDDGEAAARGSSSVEYRSLCQEIRHRKLQRRAAKRARMFVGKSPPRALRLLSCRMLSECKASGEAELSSDDEDLANVPGKLLVGATDGGTLVGDGRSHLHMHQPLDLADVRILMEEHRVLKSVDSEHPSLEISDVSLQQVIERSGLQQLADKAGLLKKTDVNA